MKYFRCSPIEDRNMVVVGLQGGYTLRVSDQFTRGPAQEWQPAELVTYRGDQPATPQDAPLFDRSFQLIEGMWPLFDEELAPLLRPLLVSPQHGEFLPARLGDRELTLYNCWQIVQAYDDVASEFHTIPGLIGPKIFSKPVLAESKLFRAPHCFYLTPFGSQLIVDEQIHDLVSSVGRMACEFVEVEVLTK